MTLINRSSLFDPESSETFHLPPFELGIGEEELPVSEFEERPYFAESGFVETYNRLHGYRLPVRGVQLLDTVGDALAWQDSLRAFLRAGNGRAKRVELCRWLDSTQTVGRIYWGCALDGGVSFAQWEGARTERARVFEFTLRSGDPNIHKTFSNAGQPGAGPYELYLYNGEESSEISVEGDRPAMISGTMSGSLAEATNAGNAVWRQHKFILSTSKAMRVKSLQTKGCGGTTMTSSDKTRLAVSDAGYAGSGTEIICDTPGDTGVSPVVGTGDLVIAANAPVYVYAKIAGWHEDLQYIVEAERA